MLNITYLTWFYFHFVFLFKEKLLLLFYCPSYYIKKDGVNNEEVSPMSTQTVRMWSSLWGMPQWGCGDGKVSLWSGVRLNNLPQNIILFLHLAASKFNRFSTIHFYFENSIQQSKDEIVSSWIQCQPTKGDTLIRGGLSEPLSWTTVVCSLLFDLYF